MFLLKYIAVVEFVDLKIIFIDNKPIGAPVECTFVKLLVKVIELVALS